MSKIYRLIFFIEDKVRSLQLFIAQRNMKRKNIITMIILMIIYNIKYINIHIQNIYTFKKYIRK